MKRTHRLVLSGAGQAKFCPLAFVAEEAGEIASRLALHLHGAHSRAGGMTVRMANQRPSPGLLHSGTSAAESNHRVGYGEDDMASLVAISEAVAIAIRNPIRPQERNEARDDIILAMAKLAEHRDPDTGHHLERGQVYCRLLSEGLVETSKHSATIDKTFIEAIVRSSPLHDIGKVGVPDSIMLEPGKVTPDEFESLAA